MNRPFALGDLVQFKTTTGQLAVGVVIHRIIEKRQPTILLIECEDRRRAFRFETELTLLAAAEVSESDASRSTRFDSALAAPVFAGSGADD
jgi:hypothetical protein